MPILKLAATVKERLGRFNRFLKLLGILPQPKPFLWTDGAYLVFHYELVTRDDSGTEIDRDAYGLLEALCEKYGMRAGGSVFIIGLKAEAKPEQAAVTFWNAVEKKTSGELIEGDTFFVHYPSNEAKQLGVISHVIAKGATSLVRAKSP